MFSTHHRIVVWTRVSVSNGVCRVFACKLMIAVDLCCCVALVNFAYFGRRAHPPNDGDDAFWLVASPPLRIFSLSFGKNLFYSSFLLRWRLAFSFSSKSSNSNVIGRNNCFFSTYFRFREMFKIAFYLLIYCFPNVCRTFFCTQTLVTLLIPYGVWPFPNAHSSSLFRRAVYILALHMYTISFIFLHTLFFSHWGLRRLKHRFGSRATCTDYTTPESGKHHHIKPQNTVRGGYPSD